MRISLKSWVLSAAGLIYLVIMLGAFTRLKDAGLGCPDWPGCYGAIMAPTASSAGIDASKAWIEMIHRYVAGALGLLILLITVQCYKWRKQQPQIWWWSCTLLSLVILQGLLGMWTVTLRLYPIVVVAHLLGGFAILAVTWVLFLYLHKFPAVWPSNKKLQLFAGLCLIVLCVQIALGGWTSANYAALVCKDFPHCQGSLWPAMDWSNAFNITAVGIFDSPGIPLENAARVTIQMAHRLGALITTILLSILGYVLVRSTQKFARILGVLIFIALTLQILLGISNVLAGLPVAISLLHNAVAALLLLLLITVNFFVNVKARTVH
jgi:cytochrome c oxidase assembly protein subunit 15